MTLIQWLLFFSIVQVIHALGTWKLYATAGQKPWKAAIPVYNAVILMKIINRPWWWTCLLLIPVINVIIVPVIWVETIRSFGRNQNKETLLVIASLGFYIYYLNYTQQLKHIPDRSLKPRTSAGEWVSSVVFAVIAATIVHTYFMQPYTIPTGSLERTLLVGDFLFVSKFHYGARTPMTAVSFPMVHDTIPVIRKKSYISTIQYPYFRIPGFQKIKRNDIVVFSWPIDTVNAFQQYSDGKYHYKPIDKKSNYVKRCVGVPGDSLAVVDGFVHINGKRTKLPERAELQFSYIGRIKNATFNPQNLYDRYRIKPTEFGVDTKRGIFSTIATAKSAKKFENHPNVISIERNISPKGLKDPAIFPNNNKVNWNRDNFGPIYIPKAGTTVAMNLKNYSLYRRIIEVYEGSEIGKTHKLTVNGKQVLLNGKPLFDYTFLQDYYWMMGDSRHNSEDSRNWGYVPANHIVGKPVFIWFSWDANAKGLKNKIRWNRLFTTVGGNGKPVSYFYYFVALLVVYFVFNSYQKRKKKKSI